MKMRLDKELDQLGCDISADCFREILAGLFNGYYASWTDERLLYHPAEAIRYCEMVRSATRCNGLPDEMILRSLINLRKGGHRA